MRVPESAPRIIERGNRPCEECERPHDLRDSLFERGGLTWADPDDGHLYQPMEWEEVARQLASALKAVAETAGPGLPAARAAANRARHLWEPLTREEGTP